MQPVAVHSITKQKMSLKRPSVEIQFLFILKSDGQISMHLLKKATFILLSNFLATQLKHYYQDLAYFLYWCKKYTQSVHKNPWINFPSLSSCSMFLTFPTKFKPQDHNIPAHHMKMFDTVFQILVFRSSPKA